MDTADDTERRIERRILASQGIKPKKLRQIPEDKFFVLADLGCSVAYTVSDNMDRVWAHIQIQLARSPDTVKHYFLRKRQEDRVKLSYTPKYYFWTGVGDEQDDPS